MAIVVRAAPTTDEVQVLEPRAPGGRALGGDDVLDMHEFLAVYRGDLRDLLEPPGRDLPSRRTGAA